MHGSTGTDTRPIKRLCNSYDAYAPSLITPSSITATPSATATEANAHPVTCSFEGASYNMTLKHIYSLPLCSTATSYSVSPRRQCRPWYQRTQHVSPYITRLAGLSGMGEHRHLSYSHYSLVAVISKRYPHVFVHSTYQRINVETLIRGRDKL